VGKTFTRWTSRLEAFFGLPFGLQAALIILAAAVIGAIAGGVFFHIIGE